MKTPALWSASDLLIEPFKSIRDEVDNLFHKFSISSMPISVEAKIPSIDVSESKGAVDVTAELPGVEEKDIKVNIEGNRLVISGKKNHESNKDEKDWHLIERSYGSFYRSMLLPFTPNDGAVQARLVKGVLHITLQKPHEVITNTKTIPVQAGATSE